MDKTGQQPSDSPKFSEPDNRPVLTRANSASRPGWTAGATYLWTVVLILLLATGVRVAAAVVWQNRAPAPAELVWGDSTTYWEIAENWVATGTYEFGEPPQRIFRAPGYPVVLIAAMQVAQSLGHPLTVFQARLVGCGLGTLAVGLLIGWATDLSGNRRTGLWAGLFMALEPGAVAMSVFILAEAAFIPVMLLSLWTWTVAWRQRTLLPILTVGLLAGLMTGVGILIRPSWLLFAPTVAVLAVCGLPQRPKQVVLAVAVAVGIALSLFPWWCRNYELSGRWVPTTLQVGASLYDGWNPHADGGSDMTHGYAATRPLLQQYRQQIEQRLPDLDRAAIERASLDLELASNDRLAWEARQWARQNPSRLLQLFAIKVWRTWRPWPAASEVSSSWMTWASVVTFLPLMGLVLAGIVWCGRRQYDWVMLVWPAVYLTLLHGVFVGSIRYRQPAMIPLLIVAAMAVVYFISRHSDNSGKSP